MHVDGHARNSLSRGNRHKLIADGRGPRLSKLGARSLISSEAAVEWRRDLEQAAAAQ
jgi:hypothetical protein